MKKKEIIVIGKSGETLPLDSSNSLNKTEVQLLHQKKILKQALEKTKALKELGN